MIADGPEIDIFLCKDLETFDTNEVSSVISQHFIVNLNTVNKVCGEETATMS